MKLEADEFCTSMVERRSQGGKEQFALVMGNHESNTRLYFFITRDMVQDIVQSLVEMVRYDA
jgi:hypothetical protein